MRYSAIVDVHGRPVEVGTRVRVLSLPAGVIERVEADEVDRLMSMVGEVLEVDEIDEYGSAWVVKWWHMGSDRAQSHSLGLSAENMEVA